MPLCAIAEVEFMPRFFVNAPVNELTEITGTNAAHAVKSLRMREGDSIILCDGSGTDYHGIIVSASPDLLSVKVQSHEKSLGEPKSKIVLYQALPKADKLDFIVQKATELGVCEIVPILTERCISRPDAKSMSKKIEKLSRTALEAAKQSGRGIIPQIMPLMKFENAVLQMCQTELPLFFYECATTPLRKVVKLGAKTAAVMIGSEGGFSLEEAAFVKAQGIPAVSLGSRILRCETAPICAIAQLLYALEI